RVDSGVAAGERDRDRQRGGSADTADAEEFQRVTRGPDKLIAPWGPFKCKDGYVAIIVPTESMWKKFLTAIGHTELLDNRDDLAGLADPDIVQHAE
ncbi:CoA transferase, partial [Cloacibacillus evryensis]|uniref:CoA transferase n=1 Tax=Cloacibacillus evryensis TaxID=508460 RepID=UPI00210E663E